MVVLEGITRASRIHELLKYFSQSCGLTDSNDIRGSKRMNTEDFVDLLTFYVTIRSNFKLCQYFGMTIYLKN